MSNQAPEGNIFAFWAKLPRKKDEYPPTKFHPLLCHMLDVAAVAQALWENVLTQRFRQRLATSLGFAENKIDEAGIWLAFLAGLHDLGKASPVFQLQPEAKAILHFYRNLPTSSLNKKGAWHGWITATELPEILVNNWGTSNALAKRLAVLIGGHHGSFPRSDERRQLRRDNPTDRDPRVGKGNWPEARKSLTKEIASIVFDGKVVLMAASASARIADNNADAMILAGLVSVADWLGSDERSFPYAIHAVNGDFDEPDANKLQGYFQKAQQQAQDALRKTGWLDRLPPVPQKPLAQLFSYLTAPDSFTANPLQETVERLADQITEPSLVIVEAPMGEGKTEAALYFADRWNLPPLGLEGCYFALPTQATSNQIYGRVRNFLEHRYPGRDINYQLLHGFADLHGEFQLAKERSRRQGQLPPIPTGISGEQGEGEDTVSLANVIAAEWFTHRKRALLAPFGVGTVDQALLAALQTRHVFVRHFGLAHKTIIVDEVHAYDAYMTELLKRLLQWLAALGSSVVLLSATLPAQRRRELLQAYAEGVLEEKAAAVRAASIAEAKYPRISFISATHADSVPVQVSTLRRTLRIKWVEGTIPEPESGQFPLGEALQQALIEGGCVAVICNTVARAQDTFLRLQKCFERGAKQGLPIPELDLFHARFLFEERAKREKRAVSRFGKTEAVTTPHANEEQGQRPHRAVLVATQVIEQSLDLDFDLMVSDFAPIDLLLQRSGRIHRHKRTRPAGLIAPTLWVCAPTEEDGVPVFERGTEVVYEDWQHVLLRSWFELQRRTGLTEPNTALISIPSDISAMIEAAYEEQDAPTNISAALQQAWANTREEQQMRLEKLAKRAAGVSIAPPLDPGDLLNEWNKKLVEDDPEIDPKLQALTRPEPNVQVVCLLPDELAAAKLGSKPDRETAIYLLGRSVSLSNRQLISDLLSPANKQFVEQRWKESPYLRNHRLLRFDTNRECMVGKITLHLDEELGLCIRYRKHKEE